MRKAKDLGYRRILITSAVLEVVNVVSRVEDLSINLCVKDILFLMSFFEIVRFTHIAWKFNKATHSLAKFSIVQD